ncbi:MAG: hypothetical protein ACK56F_12255, partial [bacterium]
MTAAAIWSVSVVLHRWIAKTHDLVIAVVVLHEDSKLLVLARCALGLIVTLENFTGVTNTGHQRAST